MSVKKFAAVFTYVFTLSRRSRSDSFVEASDRNFKKKKPGKFPARLSTTYQTKLLYLFIITIRILCIRYLTHIRILCIRGFIVMPRYHPGACANNRHRPNYAFRIVNVFSK